MNNKIKTIGATTIFSLAGIVSLFFINNFLISLPLIVFYITLTINTYFSIKLFSSIIPNINITQKVFDSLLFILYICLVFSFNNPIIFIYIVCLLFIIASLKYIFLLSVIDYNKLLKRKIIIDTLGIVMAIISLGAILIGYPTLGAWFLSMIFLFANIFLLVIRPMYRI